MKDSGCRTFEQYLERTKAYLELKRGLNFIDITDPEKAKEIRQVIKEIIDKAKVIVRIYSAEKEEEIDDKTCNIFEFNKEQFIIFHCVLSLIGEDGYPYGLPINQWYCEEDGKIYFHGAKEGHKIDAIKACDKVSFCTWDEGYRKEGDWALNINSVIVFGRIKFVEDEDTAIKICTHLTKKFTDDEEYLQKELKNALPRVQCLELIPEHITGKLVNES